MEESPGIRKSEDISSENKIENPTEISNSISIQAQHDTDTVSSLPISQIEYLKNEFLMFHKQQFEAQQKYTRLQTEFQNLVSKIIKDEKLNASQASSDDNENLLFNINTLLNAKLGIGLAYNGAYSSPVLSPMQNPSDRESEYFNQPLSLNSISQQHAAIQIVKNASSPLKDGEI